MKFSAKKQSLAQLQRSLLDAIHTIPQWLLVDHIRLISTAILLTAFGVAVYLMIILLFVTPPGTEAPEQPETTLRTDTIDRLEFWIEVRHSEGQRPIVPIGKNVF